MSEVYREVRDWLRRNRPRPVLKSESSGDDAPGRVQSRSAGPLVPPVISPAPGVSITPASTATIGVEGVPHLAAMGEDAPPRCLLESLGLA